MLLYFKARGLSASQMVVVQRGLACGLNRQQISLYADPAFSSKQMEEIRLGFLDGLSDAQIRVFADPRVSVEEMKRIRTIYQKSADIDKELDQLDRIIKDAKRRSNIPGNNSTQQNAPNR